TGRKLDGLPHRLESRPRAAFSHDGRFVAGTGIDNTARIWDMASGHIVREIIGHQGAVVSADFSPNDKLVVTASEDRTAQVWNTSTGERVCGPLSHGATVNSAVFSHNGRWILTASNDTTARIWDAATGKRITEFPGSRRVCTGAAFSPDDRV